MYLVSRSRRFWQQRAGRGNCLFSQRRLHPRSRPGVRLSLPARRLFYKLVGFKRPQRQTFAAWIAKFARYGRCSGRFSNSQKAWRAEENNPLSVRAQRGISQQQWFDVSGDNKSSCSTHTERIKKHIYLSVPGVVHF